MPTDAEWTTLENYVSANLGTSGSVAKALASKTDWASSTSGGAIGNDLTKNDATGFTVLPGAHRGDNGTFEYIGYGGGWWSSTEYGTFNAWFRYLDYNDGDIYRGNNSSKEYGFSVRCVRD